MIEPRATLRLQFHAGFTLDDALPWLDYFADLGISHLYASPLFRARPGSSHGYDVVDPTRINPELGGEPALLRLVQGLRQRGMGLLMDIVPNHMGIGGGANPWWQDVLEWGRESPYASFFDIQWNSHDAALRGQVLLPFLRSDYGEVLAAGEIGLCLDAGAGRLLASHGEQRFPLWPGSYPELLEDSGEPRLAALAAGFRESRQDREALREMQRQLAATLAEGAPRAALERTLGALQEDHGETRQRLHRLLEAQHYRLASWRTAADDINWRRFFDISELVGLRVERGEVFEAVHGKVFQLLEDGLLDGLRIDHVDGLADPRGYCRRLRRRSERIRARRGGAPMLLYVEKILAGEERLPEDWQCDGSTGYDFMNQVSLLQHDPRGERRCANSGRGSAGVRRNSSRRFIRHASWFWPGASPATWKTLPRACCEWRGPTWPVATSPSAVSAARCSSCSRDSRSIAPTPEPAVARRRTARYSAWRSRRPARTSTRPTGRSSTISNAGSVASHCASCRPVRCGACAASCWRASSS